MTQEQLLPALIAVLVQNGTPPKEIEVAVAQVRSVKLGESYAQNPLVRAFAHEQAALLTRR